jgi:hypothetical protein
MKYIRNILISIDQFVNTIFAGDPDETISSRVGKNYNGSTIHHIIDFIFIWQKKKQGHSEAAIEWDEGKDSLLK